MTENLRKSQQFYNKYEYFQQIIFVTELNPPNSDYMYGKQGLVNGLVPRAFLELLDE